MKLLQLCWTLWLLFGVGGCVLPSGKPLVVASKAFPESRLLAEVMARLLETRTNLPVERRLALGGTTACFDALRRGEIDLYPEYTGTGLAVILEIPEPIRDPAEAYRRVKADFFTQFGLVWLEPFGFNNGYAMVMRRDRAEAMEIERISDLSGFPGTLRLGLTHEFLNRQDGYLGLVRAYGLERAEVIGMEHQQAYEAVMAGRVDVIDAYTTDAQLREYDLRVLEDDRGFFPSYHAAPLLRSPILKEHPEVGEVLGLLAGRIDEGRMAALNHQLWKGRSAGQVAEIFLREEGLLR